MIHLPMATIIQEVLKHRQKGGRVDDFVRSHHWFFLTQTKTSTLLLLDKEKRGTR
jgi:hypothetical protein